MTFILAQFENPESPFTELFSLLKRRNMALRDLPTLDYTVEERLVIAQHAENAMDILLRGLQSVGNLMSCQSADAPNDIGFFIAAVSNLAQALNTLQLDIAA